MAVQLAACFCVVVVMMLLSLVILLWFCYFVDDR